MLKLSCIYFITLLASATLTFGQNPNQAAVDTLTKNVATVVFENLKQLPNNLKAAQLYDELRACEDGCDAMDIIRKAGGYDAVGVKMQELGLLKNTANFVAMSPAEANAAIRKQLAQFYAHYKNDKNYGKPLSPVVQEQILAKIDNLLPPVEVIEAPLTTSTSVAAPQPDSQEDTSVAPAALQISRLESQVKNEQEKQFWMILVSAFVGLLAGAAAVYFLLYSDTKKEANRLHFENLQLSKSLDAAQRNKPNNERRQPGDVERQKAKAYDILLTELGAGIDPLVAIQQLKQQTPDATLEPDQIVRLSEPIVEPGSASTNESIPTQNQVRTVPAEQSPEPTPPPVRSEVFYFPPPDPSGQFDLAQKTGALSPESAYRFSISADNPSLASFRFEAEPGRVARFLTYRNYMIEPACESENSYTATHNRIAMRRDGQAILENGVWRVKTKALIRYE